MNNRRHRNEGEDWVGPWPRLAPIAAVAAAYGLRLAKWPTPWGSVLDYAGWGFGLLALAAAAHCMALLCRKYELDTVAWVITVVVAGIMVVLFAPAGGE
jgi:hypothetical protein